MGISLNSGGTWSDGGKKMKGKSCKGKGKKNPMPKKKKKY